MRRGFVMVIFLGLATILMIVLGALLISNKHNKVVAVRESDELRARAIAEACLSKGVAVAIGHFRARGGESFDFDRLLDPNGVSGDDDDHVFANVSSPNVIVYVPKDARGTPTEALFRYSFERFDPDGAGPSPPGACYLRFDDNADDNVPGYTAQTGNTGIPEGAGVNVNNRDRDASIAVTAIGVFPVLPGVPDDDAYGRAHARVTMRQFFSASSAPAVYSDGTIRIEGADVEICGTGGLNAATVHVAAGSCACGNTFAETVNGLTTTPSGVAQCIPSECPRSLAPVAIMDREALPTAPGTGAAGYHVDFPTACLNYGETIGEPPPRFVATDPVTANDSTAPTTPALLHPETAGNYTTSTYPLPRRNEAHLRLHVRRDGAVFVWDGRPRPNAAALPSRPDVDTGAAVTPPRCDGFPARPDAFDPAKKNQDCVDAHGAGAVCRITGDPFDIERCQLPQTCNASNPCTAPATCEAGVCMTSTRCDQFDRPDYASTAPTTASRDAICNAILPGSTCNPQGNPRAPTTCAAPGVQLVNCSQVGPNDVNRPLGDSDVNVGAANGLPIPGWPDMSTPIAVVANPALTPNATNANATTGPLNNSNADRAAARLCWRMVSQLNDGPSVASDGFNTPEWQVGGGFALTSVNVPYVVDDTSRFPQNTPVRRATVADVAGGFDTDRFPELTLNQPVFRRTGPGRFEILGFDNTNTASRRLPTPAALFFDGDVRVLSGARLDGVSIAATGSITLEDNVTIVALGVPSTTGQISHPHGQAGVDACSDEAGVAPVGAQRAWLGSGARSTFHPVGGVPARDRYVLRAGGNLVAEGSANLFGRVSVVGDAVFRGATCAVGGVAAQGAPGGAIFTAGCAGTPDCTVNEAGLCFGGHTGIIGSVFSNQHIIVNGGFNAMRGTRDCSSGSCSNPGNPGFKISQVISRASICINGGAGAAASRVVGQVLSDDDNGTVSLRGNVTIVQTGEVGVGFGTRRTTWLDNSW